MEDQTPIEPRNLIHGSNLISRYLRYCLIPNGLAYKFEPGPIHKPKPLPIGVALLCLLPLPSLGLVQMLSREVLSRVDRHSFEYKAIIASTFVLRMAQILSFYRVVVVVVSIFISMKQHGRISSIIAQKSNYLTEKEQARYAKLAFVFFYLNALANTLAYAVVFAFILEEELKSKPLHYPFLIAIPAFMFWLRLTNCATLIYTCYVSVCLGQHVKNFSSIYIDSMFDQFIKSVEKDEMEKKRPDPSRSPRRTRDRLASSNEPGRSDHLETYRGARGFRHALSTIWSHLVAIVVCSYETIWRLTTRLARCRYPELPEMKMSKLSSKTRIHISESARLANNHQIRVRLRKTQTMISDMRDVVSDVNKVSSPIIILYILFETMLLVFIVTASVQARVFRSVNILILPSVSVTISMASSVVCVCIFCDEAKKQLKLLTNKLFDFIIMNHRVGSSNKLLASRQRSSEEFCRLLSSESEALNEIWAQFQYTRKLADTIQFTMGGIFPVTRRLVLSVLGHVLSATFISIEIMSIVDTMNMPKTSKRTGPLNATGHHHHHHHHQHHTQI